MLVLKFGGTSVGSVQSLSSLKNIVENKSDNYIVVVSAMNGVTDKLCHAFEISFCKGEGYMGFLKDIESMHIEIVRRIVPLERQYDCIEDIKNMLDQVENILNCISVLKESRASSRDFVLSFGELLSSRVVVAMFDKANFLDARDMIVTDESYGLAKVYREESLKYIRALCSKTKGIKVVNDFCGKTRNGYTTSLGRSSVGVSASLIAIAMGIEKIMECSEVIGRGV